MLKSNLNTVFLKLNTVVIFGLTILLFCFDFLDKIEIFLDIDFPKLNRFIKAGAIFYAIGFIGLNVSYVFKNLKYLIITAMALLMIFAFKYDYFYLYFEEFCRYAFILFLFPLLHFYFQTTEQQDFLKLFYWILKIFMIVNIIAIITGILFNMEIFHTYQYGRSGYNGLLLSQGLTPYVYMSATVIFWTKKDYMMLGVVLLASALSGIKGVYLGEFMLILLLLYFSQNLNKVAKIWLAVVSFVSFLIALIVIFSTPKFKDVIEKDGMMSAIFSYRIDNLIELIETSPKDNFNYLIGALGLQTIRLEMQLFDIMLFFGIFGIFTYIYFMGSVYRDIVITNSSKAFFIAALSLSVLSGNLFYIPLAILLFFLTLFCLNRKNIHSE